MQGEVKLSRVRTVLDELEYPLSKTEAREAFEGVTLLYADGEEPLAAVVGRANVDTFDGVEDLESSIFNNVPVEAVGEPGQSEGEG